MTLLFLTAKIPSAEKSLVTVALLPTLKSPVVVISTEVVDINVILSAVKAVTTKLFIVELSANIPFVLTEVEEICAIFP